MDQAPRVYPIFILRSAKSGFLAKIKTQVSRIRKSVCVNKKDKPRAVRRRLRKQIEQQINADALRRQFGNELTGTIVTAVCNIKYADKLFIKGAAVTQEHREQVSRRISQESMERFLNSVTIDFGRIENPVAYLQTSLYTYHQKLLQPSQAEPVSTGTSERCCPPQGRELLQQKCEKYNADFRHSYNLFVLSSVFLRIHS